MHFCVVRHDGANSEKRFVTGSDPKDRGSVCEELSLEILKQVLVSSIFGTCLPNYQHFFVTFLKFQCHENEFVTRRVINKQQVSQRKVAFSVRAG